MLLYELHDRAREQGIKGFRRMSKAELAAALGVSLDDGDARPDARSGPTEVSAVVRHGLAVITLDGADNALSLQTLADLADTAGRLVSDESVRLVAITGAGSRLFSSGADLPSMAARAGAEVTAVGTDACRRIASLEVPTVALLNGHAVGGAIDLALACDWRIAVQGSKLRFIHNELGYSPPWGGAARLSALVGRPTALRLFATCELLAVEEARSLGVVDEVVGPNRLLSRAESLAARIGRANREAVAATKRLIAGEPDLTAHEQAFADFWDRAATLPT